MVAFFNNKAKPKKKSKQKKTGQKPVLYMVRY